MKLSKLLTWFIYFYTFTATLWIIMDYKRIKLVGARPVNPAWLLITPVYMVKRMKLFRKINRNGRLMIALSIIVYIAALGLAVGSVFLLF